MSQRWWEQVGIDLEGTRKQAEVSAASSETESEEGSDGATGGGGKEKYQGASGTSGAYWSGVEDG